MNAALTNWLRETADHWASWMGAISWQVLILVTILSVVTWVLRGQSARMRHALWLLVLVRLMLPPQTAFPTGYGWWLGQWSPTHALTATGARNLSAGVEGNTSLLDRESGQASVLSWNMILFLLWSGILAMRLGMLLMAWIQVRNWVARARPIIDPDVLNLMLRAQQKVDWQGEIELCNSEACSTPLVVGTWRPVILLPQTILDRLSADELEAVLVHELIHVKRRDGFVRMLQAVLECIYFFHPAVWWASSQLRQLREDACDEASVAVLGKRKAYGSALVSTAEILGYAAPPLALGVLDARQPVVERVRRILDPSLPIAPVSAVKYAALLVVPGMILLPAGTKLELRKDIPIAIETREWEPSPTPKVPATKTDSAANSLIPDVATSNSIENSLENLREIRLRQAAIRELQSQGAIAEPAVIQFIATADTAGRMAAYEVLEMIGQDRAKEVLAAAYLERTGAEQFAAQRALDAVAARIRTKSERVQAAGSLRFFAPPTRP